MILRETHPIRQNGMVPGPMTTQRPPGCRMVNLGGRNQVTTSGAIAVHPNGVLQKLTLQSPGGTLDETVGKLMGKMMGRRNAPQAI